MRILWKLASAVVCLLAPLPLFAIAVTSTANAGPGTLRQAILDAELTAASDTITFAVNPADLPITLSSALPTITHPIVIDGTTQPAYAGVPIIEIDGNGVSGQGLKIFAGSSTVKALILRNFNGDGIQLFSNSNTVTNCYIGTNAAGSAASANTGVGINVQGNSNTIGGDTTKRNVISGNASTGILISSFSSGTAVQGNYIGLN
ncbi:MAG TPA: hypothetical protein VGQ32_02095, partial [Thermoanaerobaculia bacterium]|nr:hypothetical protein [Thermoanaerobaculia bacterium]